MATGKKAKDLWQSTTKVPKVGLEVAPRGVRGRTAGPDYEKVTVCRAFPGHNTDLVVPSSPGDTIFIS